MWTSHEVTSPIGSGDQLGLGDDTVASETRRGMWGGDWTWEVFQASPCRMLLRTCNLPGLTQLLPLEKGVMAFPQGGCVFFMNIACARALPQGRFMRRVERPSHFAALALDIPEVKSGAGRCRGVHGVWGPARPHRGPAPETSPSHSPRSGELCAFSGLSGGIFRGRAFCKSTSST